MMFEAIRLLEGPTRASWLHELRNVVSTASVATSVSRRLVREDASSAIELLQEAERALERCRELLADGVEPSADEVAAFALPLRPTGAPAERRRRGTDVRKARRG